MKNIVNKLVDNGYEAYIVGGYVRDYLLGVESLDVDISTNAPINKIQELTELLQEADKQEKQVVNQYIKK